MSNPFDYRKWDKLVDQLSSDDDDEAYNKSGIDPYFARKYLEEKILKDAMGSRKPNVIKQKKKEDKQAKIAESSPNVEHSPKTQKSKSTNESVKVAAEPRKKWHEIGLVDKRWANIKVTSSEELEDVGGFGMIDPAQACKMLLETGRRELPKERR